MAPTSFAPTDKHRDLAKRLELDVEQELAKFRGFEFKDPKSDFNDTFNRWLRNAAWRRRRNAARWREYQLHQEALEGDA